MIADFCMKHNCSIENHRCCNTGDLVYGFRFKDHGCIFTIPMEDVINIERETLIKHMLTAVEHEYLNRRNL